MRNRRHRVPHVRDVGLAFRVAVKRSMLLMSERLPPTRG
jgi:hypothetical protein